MNPSDNNLYNDWDDDWETSDVTLVRTPAQQQALEARQREEEEDHLLTEALFRGETMSSAKGTQSSQVKSVVSSLQNIQQSHKKPKNEERFLANLQRQQAQAKQARERKEREKRAMELFGEASTQDDLFNTYEAIMYE